MSHPEVLFRHSWSPEDESWRVCWFPLSIIMWIWVKFLNNLLDGPPWNYRWSCLSLRRNTFICELLFWSPEFVILAGAILFCFLNGSNHMRGERWAWLRATPAINWTALAVNQALSTPKYIRCFMYWRRLETRNGNHELQRKILTDVINQLRRRFIFTYIFL